jgi:hypothetical protein
MRRDEHNPYLESDDARLVADAKMRRRLVSGLYVDRDVDVNPYLLPNEVALSAPGEVTYSFAPGCESATKPQRVPLEHFLSLANADDAVIVEFIREHGPLYLCAAHGLHLLHEYVSCGHETVNWNGCPLELRGPRAYVERTEMVRDTARRGLAMVRLAACHHLGEAPFVDDMETLAPGNAWSVQEVAAGRADLAQFIMSELCRWSGESNIVYQPAWDQDRVSARTLFGGLSLALLCLVRRAGGSVICSDCGGVYTPKRMPSAGRNRFCLECGSTGKNRFAKRAQRARERILRA